MKKCEKMSRLIEDLLRNRKQPEKIQEVNSIKKEAEEPLFVLKKIVRKKIKDQI